MSFGSRFGWGKFSPFGRPSPTSPAADTSTVTDSDFSYITSDDIARSKEEERASRPGRDTDAICLKHKRISYPVHFPAYSIDDGELTIAKIREAAAKRVDVPVSSADRIKLFYKGKNLKDDARTARDEGMRSDSQPEILLVVGDQIVTPDSESEDGEEEDTKTGKKKRKSRKRKKKSGRSSNSGTATPVSEASGYRGGNVMPDATFAPGAAPPPPKPSSPAPVKAAQTALEKLDALASHFHTTLVPPCIQFLNSPPADEAKRQFDHKRLTETVLAQVILKLDGVETEGNPEARARRKELVNEAQGMLNKLDASMKK